MKKLAFIFLLFAASMQGQVVIPMNTLLDTTMANGHRFVITYPAGVEFNIIDSVEVVSDTLPPVHHPEYISFNESTVTLKIKRDRIFDGDTLTKYYKVTAPLKYMNFDPNDLLTGWRLIYALKAESLNWLNMKISEE